MARVQSNRPLLERHAIPCGYPNLLLLLALQTYGKAELVILLLIQSTSFLSFLCPGSVIINFLLVSGSCTHCSEPPGHTDYRAVMLSVLLCASWYRVLSEWIARSIASLRIRPIRMCPQLTPSFPGWNHGIRRYNLEASDKQSMWQGTCVISRPFSWEIHRYPTRGWW